MTAAHAAYQGLDKHGWLVVWFGMMKPLEEPAHSTSAVASVISYAAQMQVVQIFVLAML